MNLLEVIDEIINETENPATIPEEKPPAPLPKEDNPSATVAENQNELALEENIISYQPDKTPIGIYWLESYEEWLIFSLEDDLKKELQKRGVRLYRGYRFERMLLITQDVRFGNSLGKVWGDYQFVAHDPNYED